MNDDAILSEPCRLVGSTRRPFDDHRVLGFEGWDYGIHAVVPDNVILNKPRPGFLALMHLSRRFTLLLKRYFISWRSLRFRIIIFGSLTHSNILRDDNEVGNIKIGSYSSPDLKLRWRWRKQTTQLPIKNRYYHNDKHDWEFWFRLHMAIADGTLVAQGTAKKKTDTIKTRVF